MERADRPASSLHVLRLTPYYYLPERELDHRELQYEPIGGMQVQIMQTTEEVSANGATQSVVFPRRPGMARRVERDDRTSFELLKLPVTPFPTRSKGYIGLLVSWGLAVLAWAIGQRVRGLHRRFSLIHVHCSELPWTFLFAVLAKLVLRRPLMLTTHCSAIATFHPETLLGKLLIGPARVFERMAVRRADAAIVLTERVREVYLDLGLTTPERVHVVPDGVRLDVFRPSPRSVDGQVDADAAPVVLYCGRFAPEKGWADFIEAAAVLVEQGTDARFVMCGDGNELKHCRARLRELAIADRVELRGHLDRDEIAGEIKRATIVVIPSRHEEMGGTVLEALAAGRAVVVTDVGGLPHAVDHGEAGLIVPPYDPPAIAAAVNRHLDSPQLRARCGQRGMSRVVAYDLSTVTSQLVGIYHAIAAQRSPQPVASLPVRDAPLVAIEPAEAAGASY